MVVIHQKFCSKCKQYKKEIEDLTDLVKILRASKEVPDLIEPPIDIETKIIPVLTEPIKIPPPDLFLNESGDFDNDAFNRAFREKSGHKLFNEGEYGSEHQTNFSRLSKSYEILNEIEGTTTGSGSSGTGRLHRDTPNQFLFPNRHGVNFPGENTGNDPENIDLSKINNKCLNETGEFDNDAFNKMFEGNKSNTGGKHHYRMNNDTIYPSEISSSTSSEISSSTSDEGNLLEELLEESDGSTDGSSEELDVGESSAKYFADYNPKLSASASAKSSSKTETETKSKSSSKTTIAPKSSSKTKTPSLKTAKTPSPSPSLKTKAVGPKDTFLNESGDFDNNAFNRAFEASKSAGQTQGDRPKFKYTPRTFTETKKTKSSEK